MTELVGYQLVDQASNVIQSWGGVIGQCPGVPDILSLPNGDQVHCPAIGAPYGEWTLQPWNMSPPAPTPDSLIAYAEIAQTSHLAAGATFDLGGVSILCDGANSTRADLALLALFGQSVPTGQKSWIDNNGVVTSLTGAQCVTLAMLAGTWISDSYTFMVSIMSQIGAGAITTTAQIDALSWPTT